MRVGSFSFDLGIREIEALLLFEVKIPPSATSSFQISSF